MVMYCDGVVGYVIPECAKCQLTGKNPADMTECPEHRLPNSDMCEGDCDYYTEEWD